MVCNQDGERRRGGGARARWERRAPARKGHLDLVLGECRAPVGVAITIRHRDALGLQWHAPVVIVVPPRTHLVRAENLGPAFAALWKVGSGAFEGAAARVEERVENGLDTRVHVVVVVIIIRGGGVVVVVVIVGWRGVATNGTVGARREDKAGLAQLAAQLTYLLCLLMLCALEGGVDGEQGAVRDFEVCDL